MAKLFGQLAELLAWLVTRIGAAGTFVGASCVIVEAAVVLVSEVNAPQKSGRKLPQSKKWPKREVDSRV